MSRAGLDVLGHLADVLRATIVAANRAFPETHMVSQLLSPHWFKTLSLNAAARSALVPNVISPIAGMKKEHRECIYTAPSLAS